MDRGFSETSALGKLACAHSAYGHVLLAFWRLNCDADDGPDAREEKAADGKRVLQNGMVSSQVSVTSMSRGAVGGLVRHRRAVP